MARWDRLRTRGNVEDRRGVSRPAAAVGGLGAIGVVVVLLISMLGGSGGGLEDIVGQLQETQVPEEAAVQPEEFQGEDEYEVFASTVLGSTDETWGQIFLASELTYAEPTLVLFRGSTQSACGGANSAVGPHYCPPDQTIYLDETFFDRDTHQGRSETFRNGLKVVP